MEVKSHYYDLWLDSAWGKESIYKEDDVLCLRSNINLGRANVAWGIKNHYDIKNIRNFFKENEFHLYTNNPISSPHLTFISGVKEMVLKALKPVHTEAKVKDYNNVLMHYQPDLPFWNYVFVRASNKPMCGTYDFLQLLKESSNFHTLLMSLPDGPVATTAISIKNETGLLNFVSVMENYRRQKVGSTMLQMTMQFGIKLGVKKFILYSPESISDFYSNLGFQASRDYYFYRNAR